MPALPAAGAAPPPRLATMTSTSTSSSQLSGIARLNAAEIGTRSASSSSEGCDGERDVERVVCRILVRNPDASSTRMRIA